jgi:hypothetical protein
VHELEVGDSGLVEEDFTKARFSSGKRAFDPGGDEGVFGGGLHGRVRIESGADTVAPPGRGQGVPIKV